MPLSPLAVGSSPRFVGHQGYINDHTLRFRKIGSTALFMRLVCRKEPSMNEQESGPLNVENGLQRAETAHENKGASSAV